MLASVTYEGGAIQPVSARTANGSLKRSFTLPMELSGVTMSIGGATVGLKYVSRRQIDFVVPAGLFASAGGTSYDMVINSNGTVYKGRIALVPAQPDIFTESGIRGPGGQVRSLNVTNRIFTKEPYAVSSFLLKGSRKVPTKVRIYLTGVGAAGSDFIIVRFGTVAALGASEVSLPRLSEPGVYYIDVSVPADVAGKGAVPIVISAPVSGVTFRSREEDTAPRILFH